MVDPFLVIEGENPAAETVLVIWRNIKEKDNAALEQFVTKTLRLNPADTEYAAIYINGEPAGTYTGFQFDYGIAYSNMEEGFLIGKNPIDLAPTEPIRDWATYPSRYTFDGIIDDVALHNRALSPDEVVELMDVGLSTSAVEPAEKLVTTWASIPAERSGIRTNGTSGNSTTSRHKASA